jgi:predicted RNA-binding protein associated with RNAse of E/G family
LMGERYGKSSTIITTNLDYSDWYGLFQKKSLVDALLDRLKHQCITITINGPSLIEGFKDFFNFMTDSVSWQHSVDLKNNAQRYYVDVTKMPLDQIIKVLNKLKSEFVG